MVVDNKNLCTNCFEEYSEYQGTCQSCGYSDINKEEPTYNLPAGTILLGKFIIGKLLGKGGFGITYLAYDLRRECKVAIKEYMPDTLSYRTPGNTLVSTYLGEKEESFKLGSEKFYEEAKTISKFNGHPNVINVYEFFYENNTAYFVMEYIAGMDLKTYIMRKGGMISEEECITLLTPIMDALIIVHSIGILHRDISPDNIYIANDGNVKLLDFGAARQVLGEKSKSLSVILKPGFAPFEQYQTRGNQGPWTDIYALAATMYYCLAGHIPEAAMDRIEEDKIKSLSEFNVNVSKTFEKVLQKALSVKGVDRYQTMGEFKQAIMNAGSIVPNKEVALVMNNNQSNVKSGFGSIKSDFKSRNLIISLATVCVIFIFTCIGFAVWQASKNDSTESRNGNVTQNLTAVSNDENTTQRLAASSSNRNTAQSSVEATSNENATQNSAVVSSKDTASQNSKKMISKETAAQNSPAVMSDGSTPLKKSEPSKSSITPSTSNFTNDSEKDDEVTFVSNVDYLYVTKFISAKSKYTGLWMDNKPNGVGLLEIVEDGENDFFLWSIGDKYSGDFKNGVLNGKGKCEYTKRKVIYECDFVNGLADGQGTIKYSDGWLIYEGQFKNNYIDGYGTYYWKDGEKYVGESKKGKKEGKGCIYDANGNIIKQGIWANDQFVEN